MRKRHRVICSGAAVLIAGVIGSVGGATPASALDVSKCQEPGGNVCINVDLGYAQAVLYGGGGYPVFDATLVLYQCGGNGSGCAMIGTAKIPDGWDGGSFSKRAPYSHTFKACASWTDAFGHRWVNLCTPLAASLDT